MQTVKHIKSTEKHKRGKKYNMFKMLQNIYIFI